LSRYANTRGKQLKATHQQSFPGAIDSTHKIDTAKIEKSRKGLTLATSKALGDLATNKARVPAVAREETELDELSNRTLGRYATRAAQSGDTAIRMSNTDDDGMGKIANKRFAGVKLATRKMAARTGDKATATRIATNLDKAKIAGQGASTLSNKDREDSGKAHYAAMRGIDKLRGESFENEETELDEISDELAGKYDRENNKQRRKLSNPYGHSPEDAKTLRKREAGKVSLVTRKFNKMKNANEETEE
jgi:hypothetical protein